MQNRRHRNTILMADDDPFSCKLAEIALQELRHPSELHSVADGEELFDYLHRRGKYSEPGEAPRPALILLDLNMPRKDGRAVLREIRETPEFAEIPVVVMTSSSTEEDIWTSYRLGANSFITKPVNFDGLLQVMDILSRYWLEFVQLPPLLD